MQFDNTGGKTTGNKEIGTFHAEKIPREKDILSVQNIRKASSAYILFLRLINFTLIWEICWIQQVTHKYFNIHNDPIKKI